MKVRVAYKGPLYASPIIFVEIGGEPQHVDEAHRVLREHYKEKGWKEK